MNGPVSDYEFEVWVDGEFCASVCGGNRDHALRDTLHYAAVYSQDGEVTLYEVIRQECPIPDLLPMQAKVV